MKIKTAWFICIGALIVALPVRVYQMLFLVNSTTGFFTDQNVIAIFLAIIMVVVSSIIMFMCFYDKNAPKQFKFIKNIPAAIAAALGGSSMIAHSVYSLLIDNGQLGRSLSENAADTAVMLESGQAYLNVIMAFVGLVSGIIILLGAFGFVIGKDVFRFIPVVAIFPPLWFCVNLIMLFTNYTNVTHMTENIMDMFSMIFITLFLLSQGKMFAKVNMVQSGKRIYAFGLPAILYGFVSALPSFILQACDMSHTSSLKMTLNLAIFLLAVYALVYLLVYPKIPNYREELQEETATSRRKVDGEELPIRQASVQQVDALYQKPYANQSAAQGAVGESELNFETENGNVEPVENGEEIPYLINRDSVFKMEKKKRKKKKKNRSVFYYLPIVKQYIDKKEAQEKRPAWIPASKEKDSAVKLENDWLLDMYGYERRTKESQDFKEDEPYFPRVVDTRDIGKEQIESADEKEMGEAEER